MPTKNCGKIVALIIVIVAILVGGYVFAKKAGYLPENGKSYIVQSLLGGDKDEHGCIGSAGYSWCEAKQKCLRVWEEKCEIFQEYYTYTNSVGKYSVDLPKGWWIVDKDSSNKPTPSFVTLPPPIRDLKENEEVGNFNCNIKDKKILVNTSNMNEKNYRIFFKNFNVIDRSKFSSIIKEVRMGEIISDSEDDKGKDCVGTRYAILTNKRVYSVDFLTDNAKEELTLYIERMLASLSEN